MARRSNGEGTVYPYGNGFRAVGTIGGKRRYFKASTRRQAQQKLGSARQQAVMNPTWNPDGDDPTVADWLEYWLETIKKTTLEPSTYHSYRGLIDRHLVPVLGAYTLSQVDYSHIDTFHQRMLDRGLSVSTIKQSRTVLGQALRIARQRGKVTRNVIVDTDPPRGRAQQARTLTANEVATILTAPHSPRDLARWTLALLYGLRQGEVLALTWDDLDFDAGRLSITRALKRRPGLGLVIESTKTPKSRRQIHLDVELVAVLREHRRVQHTQRLAAGSLWDHHSLIFTTSRGTPVHPSDDGKQWRAMLSNLDIPHYRLHDARHTAATLSYEAGAPIDDVQLLLGHSSLDFTRRTYVHTQRVDTTATVRNVRQMLHSEQVSPHKSETG